MSERWDDLSVALTGIDHKPSRKLPEARLSQNKVIWSTLNCDFQERLRPHLRSGSRRRRGWIDDVVYRWWILIQTTVGWRQLQVLRVQRRG
jgi:hypothetical protein